MVALKEIAKIVVAIIVLAQVATVKQDLKQILTALILVTLY